MHLKLSNHEKKFISEIAGFTGYPQTEVRDLEEIKFIRLIEEYYSNKTMDIPFIGKLHIEYKGDTVVAGCREAILEITVEPSEILKRVIGEVEDGESDIITNLLEQKIKSSVYGIISND